MNNLERQGKKKHLIMVILLSIAMVIAMIPAMSMTAHGGVVEDRILYFNGENLYTDEECNTPYTAQTDNWFVDSATNTLTLKNFSFETTAKFAMWVVGGIEGTVNIKLEGKNLLKSAFNGTDNTAGLNIDSKTVISGEGSLILQGGATGSKRTAGLMVWQDVIISNCSVSATGGNNSGNDESYGILISDVATLTISGSAVTADGEKRALGPGTDSSKLNLNGVSATASINQDGTDPAEYNSDNFDSYKWFKTTPKHNFNKKIIDAAHLKSAATSTSPAIYYYGCSDCDEISDSLTFEYGSPLLHTITEGGNGTYQQGSKDTLTFKSDAALSDFISVSVDGKVIDKSNYTIKEGSTIVTLNADYLATLSAGKHTLAINSTTGSATTAFTVVGSTKSSEGQSPKTGDTNSMGLWIALLLLAAGTGAVVYRKKIEK